MRAPFVLALATAVSLTPASAHSQLRVAPRPDLSDPATRACVTALKPSEFLPTVVSLGAHGTLPRDSAAVHALFLLAQDVGSRIREQLGAASGVVPLVDSTLPWTAVWGRIKGEIHLDGLVTITPRPPLTLADSLALTGDSLIARALQSLIDEGERWPFEPLGWDLAVQFTLFFAAPDVTTDNTTVKTWRSVGIPVFSRSLPKYAPVRWARETTRGPLFGAWERAGMMNDSTTLRFRYDEDGIVDVRSAREVPPRRDIEGMDFDFAVHLRREPASERARARSHGFFVQAMAESLVWSRWTVGRIGTCPLPRVAHQRFRVTFGNPP